MSSKTVVKLWLEIIFDTEEVKKVVEQCPKEELRRAVLWYKAYRKDLCYLGLKNHVLEKLLPSYDELLPKEKLQVNLRAFMERLYYIVAKKFRIDQQAILERAKLIRPIKKDF